MSEEIKITDGSTAIDEKNAISRARNRLGHIDDVRSLVIFLVVMLHSSVTYSGLGGWYITENSPDTLGIAQLVAFGLFNSFNQAWFMGILFFFGGYFAASALSRKGSGHFVRDRLKRLGIPLAFYVFVISPLMYYFLVSPESFRGGESIASLYFGTFIGKGYFLGSTGPLWFAETMLLFAFAHVAISRVFGAHAPSARRAQSSRRAPTVRGLLALIGLTAAFAFATRLVVPIGTDVFNLQLAYFPAYIVLYCFGSAGFSGGWFVDVTRGKNSRFLVAAFAVGLPLWFATMLQGGALRGELDAMNGGLNLTSALYSLWESFTAIAMSVGLTASFANRAREPGKLSAFLSRNSFSVFVFHAPVLIALTRLFAGWGAKALVKAPVVGLLAWTATMAFAELVVRRVPFAKKYL